MNQMKFTEEGIKSEDQVEKEKASEERKEEHPEEYCLEQLRSGDDSLWRYIVDYYGEKSRETARKTVEGYIAEDKEEGIVEEGDYPYCHHAGYCIKVLYFDHGLSVDEIVDAIMENDGLKKIRKNRIRRLNDKSKLLTKAYEVIRARLEGKDPSEEGTTSSSPTHLEWFNRELETLEDYLEKAKLYSRVLDKPEPEKPEHIGEIKEKVEEWVEKDDSKIKALKKQARSDIEQVIEKHGKEVFTFITPRVIAKMDDTDKCLQELMYGDYIEKW